MRHLTSTKLITTEEILLILKRASFFSKCLKEKIPFPKILDGKVVANLFFENSTRTKLSFELAAKHLGAIVLNFNATSSSLAKGESLEDTLKVFEAFGIDIGIIRHSDDSFINQQKEHSPFSIVNAGAGKNEHPSQALLDIFTIQEEFQSISSKPLTVTICGDIINSRVAKSNICLLEKLGHKIQLCGPTEFLPKEAEVSKNCSLMPIDEALKNSNVFMLLRVQHERHGLYDFDVYNYNVEYGLNTTRMEKLKKTCIVMHPGPFNRGVEIESSLVDHPQSRIFKQKENGVYTRMAILEWIVS